MWAGRMASFPGPVSAQLSAQLLECRISQVPDAVRQELRRAELGQVPARPTSAASGSRVRPTHRHPSFSPLRSPSKTLPPSPAFAQTTSSRLLSDHAYHAIPGPSAKPQASSQISEVSPSPDFASRSQCRSNAPGFETQPPAKEHAASVPAPRVRSEHIVQRSHSCRAPYTSQTLRSRISFSETVTQ